MHRFWRVAIINIAQLYFQLWLLRLISKIQDSDESKEYVSEIWYINLKIYFSFCKTLISGIFTYYDFCKKEKTIRDRLSRYIQYIIDEEMYVHGNPEDYQHVTYGAFFCDTISPEMLLEIITNLNAGFEKKFFNIIVENKPIKNLMIVGDKDQWTRVF